MRRYSHFFSTLHDETGPVGNLGRGTHYSVLRAVLWGSEPYFHDFAVVWDEDHDTRVIWVLEKMFNEHLLDPALVVGERKGMITVLTRAPAEPGYSKAIEQIAQSVPNDSFYAEVEQMADATGYLINDAPERVQAYVAGIDALWSLGGKPIEFTAVPSHVE